MFHCTADTGRLDLVKTIYAAAQTHFNAQQKSEKKTEHSLEKLLNAKTSYGQTALMLACRKGYDAFSRVSATWATAFFMIQKIQERQECPLRPSLVRKYVLAPLISNKKIFKKCRSNFREHKGCRINFA